MRAMTVGTNNRNSNEPEPRGERVARFLDNYLAAHPGLSLGELAFRLRADKRDVQRLVRDRSCGHRLEDALAAYFGRIFGEAVFGPLWGDGPSRREVELERERAEIAARRERLERDRIEARSFRSAPPTLFRMASDQERRGDV
jgi:hypothetical protein